MRRSDRTSVVIAIAIISVIGITWFISPPTPDQSTAVTDAQNAGPLEPAIEPGAGTDGLSLPEHGSDEEDPGELGTSSSLFPPVPPDELNDFKPPTQLLDVTPDQAMNSATSDPSDIWYTAFLLFQKGEVQMREGQTASAHRIWKESKKLFDQLARQHADFHPDLVKFRREQLDSLIRGEPLRHRG